MKKIIIYLLFAFGVLQVACETDAEIEIPSQEPKYVITAFIKPNDNIQTLTLYQSDPIFDGIDTNNFSGIMNAVIKINNGSKTTTLKYDNTIGAYTLHKDSMLIEFDKNYSLTVEHNGKTIKTDFRTLSDVPIVINEFKIDSIVEDDPFGGSIKTYYAYTKWQDPPNEKNYYCLELFGLEIRPNGDTARFPLSDFYGNVYISDEGRNGTIMNTTLEAYGYYDGIFGGNNDYVGYEIVLSKVDEHYYKYFKSLQNYYGDDPFSEPSLIYTNINNGLGLIGSFNPFYYKKLL